MLGVSDTTLGIIVSVVLHAGVAVAFLGPLGDGEGAGDSVVMVSIDGVELHDEHGELPHSGAPQPIAPEVPQDSQGALQAPKEQPTARRSPPPVKRPQRPAPPLVSPPAQPQSGESGGGGLLGTLYSQPVMLFMPKPLYPQRARERGIEGKVTVKVLVTPEGTVERAEVVKSSGYELLDQNAQESALEARFKPALKAGVPAPAEKTMVITFSLVE